MILKTLAFFMLLTELLIAMPASDQKIRATYNSLDPTSIAQHLAFFQLYPQSGYGMKALENAWRLLGAEKQQINRLSSLSLDVTVESFIALVNSHPDIKTYQMNEEALQAIESCSLKLHNRQLKGFYAQSEEEVLDLPSEEIDLAKAIFLSQSDHLDLFYKRYYEAAIDFMALQIKARLSPHPSPEEVIATINHFIFFELGYRFPPNSLYLKEIDRYTFLSSVIDSRRGICLGISVLYLSLAQRLGLPLEIVTPPGHIYVRYRHGNKVINIETTARGVNMECEEYLSIDTCKLQERNIKETVGLVHFNQAADYLREGNFAMALNAYQKAKLYLAEDPLLNELMGLCLILCDQEQEGVKLLKRAVDSPSPCTIGKNAMCEDYLAGYTNKDYLKAILWQTENTRESLLAKKDHLQQALEKYPQGKSALFSLGMCWIQLHRLGEALDLFEKYHSLDANDPKVEYYLTILHAERYNFPKAWLHFKNLERISEEHHHHSKALKELRNALKRQCPL